MVETGKTIIIGAGPAGIAAAIGHGSEALVLEKGGAAGGLASSIQFGGALFDLGGHSFHTPHDEIKSLVFDSLEMYEQVRQARCFSHGQLIHYPFQKYFHELDSKEVVAECEKGSANLGNASVCNSFEDLLYDRFGAGIAENFLVPYNKKLWGNNLGRMAIDWVRERVAPLYNSSDTPMSAGKREALKESTIVSYPAYGGFGEIFTSLARSIKELRLQTQVVAIDPLAKVLQTKCGGILQWKRLISTLPITELIRLIDGFPADLIELSTGLESIPLCLVMVALQGQLKTEIQRIYCADSSSPAHKIVFNNNSSDYLRAQARHGILGEISMVSGDAYSHAQVCQLFTQSLLRLDILQTAEYVSDISCVDIKYGYPLPSLGRANIVAALKEKLQDYEIYTVGRFGEWDYINADEAMLRAIRLGKELAQRDSGI